MHELANYTVAFIRAPLKASNRHRVVRRETILRRCLPCKEAPMDWWKSQMGREDALARSSMNQTFSQQLSAIRIRRQAQAPVASAPPKDTSWVEQSLMCREQLQEMIENAHRVFIEAAPGFSLQRGFYEGSYVVSSAADEWRLDRAGRSNKYYSCVTFYLMPRLSEHVFEVRCKLIVRNRELEVAEWKVMLDDAVNGFQQFAEDQYCRFAQTYFAKDDTVGMPIVPSEDVSIRVWT
jgi:hypothetical protein